MHTVSVKYCYNVEQIVQKMFIFLFHTNTMSPNTISIVTRFTSLSHTSHSSTCYLAKQQHILVQITPIIVPYCEGFYFRHIFPPTR